MRSLAKRLSHSLTSLEVHNVASTTSCSPTTLPPADAAGMLLGTHMSNLQGDSATMCGLLRHTGALFGASSVVRTAEDEQRGTPQSSTIVIDSSRRGESNSMSETQHQNSRDQEALRTECYQQEFQRRLRKASYSAQLSGSMSADGSGVVNKDFGREIVARYARTCDEASEIEAHLRGFDRKRASQPDADAENRVVEVEEARK